MFRKGEFGPLPRLLETAFGALLYKSHDLAGEILGDLPFCQLLLPLLRAGGVDLLVSCRFNGPAVSE